MHNGGIGNFGHLRRDMEALIDDGFYATRRGTTDSELVFLMLLTNGLDGDPVGALSRTLEQIGTIARKRGTNGEPIRMTCAFSDGEAIYAFRTADDGAAPTLYLSDCLDHGGRAFASEPLEGPCERWRKVVPDTLHVLSRQGLVTVPFAPVGAPMQKAPVRA
jgi:glutamine amidotransferase